MIYVKKHTRQALQDLFGRWVSSCISVVLLEGTELHHLADDAR